MAKRKKETEFGDPRNWGTPENKQWERENLSPVAPKMKSVDEKFDHRKYQADIYNRKLNRD